MCDENMNLEEQVTEPVEPKVETEPLFEEMVDFDTFSKSDFRVVKVKECSAVKKSKTKKSLNARLSRLNDTSRKDNVVTFEQLAVYE